jgi:hypothetical protein
LDRTSEWFVPKFGPRNFRIGVGILFLPYTAIVTCFAAWGSLSVDFEIERLAAICAVYFLSVGVCAHCLDAVGGKTRPWGDLPRRKLAVIGLVALGIAFAIGLHYAFLDSSLLFPIGIAEAFFLFAYNLELFRGRFHNNASTVFSWGILPVFAGAAIQINSISIETLVLAGISGVITYVLIVTSRKYKELKRGNGSPDAVRKKEIMLKLLVLGVIVATASFFAVRHYA